MGSAWRCWRSSKNPKLPNSAETKQEAPPMPLDHDAEILLKMIQEANRPTFESVGAVAARDLYMAGRKALSPDPMPIAETRDVAIPGPGGPIAARLYRPAPPGPLPAPEFSHRGGGG